MKVFHKLYIYTLSLAAHAKAKFSFAYVEPFIEQFGYMLAYENSVSWFIEWGFWAVLIAGFSPIPYKVFTTAAGALNMAFLPFVIGSIIGRGTRFYLVAFLIKLFGNKIDFMLKKYMDIIGWGLVFLIIFALLLMK